MVGQRVRSRPAPSPPCAGRSARAGRPADAPAAARAAVTQESMPPLRQTTASGLHTPRSTPGHRYLWSWTCRRTPRPSSRIQRAELAGVELRRGPARRGRAARQERTLAHDVPRPLVVAPVRDHELRLVLGREQVEVAPFHPMRLARAGRLHVHDRHRAGVEARRAAMCPDVSTRTCQPASARRLTKGNAAGWESGSPPVSRTRRHGYCPISARTSSSDALPPLVERVGRVAPHAAQGASGEPHEHARLSGPGPFALDGEEDLVDGQHGGDVCTLVSGPRTRQRPCEPPFPVIGVTTTFETASLLLAS